MFSRRAFLASLASVPLLGRGHRFTIGGNPATPISMVATNGEFVIGREQLTIFRHRMTEFVTSPYQTQMKGQ